jgi:hypothetical protein
MALVLTPSHLASLKPRFLPDRPGPLIGLHVIHTGHGHAWADRWPDPHAILTETAGNYSLIGDPDALIRDDLRPLISGFVEAPDAFVPLLRAAFPDLIRWPRVIYSLPGAPYFTTPDGYTLRRLGAEDAGHLANLSEEVNWIYKTWYGAENMAASGHAWGAFADGQLVSVANSFFVGERYEDLGVITEPGFRGRGLSVACAGRCVRTSSHAGGCPVGVRLRTTSPVCAWRRRWGLCWSGGMCYTWRTYRFPNHPRHKPPQFTFFRT